MSFNAHRPSREELADLFRADDEPERIPAPSVDSALHELEKLAAADLVMRIRHIDETLLRASELECVRLAQAARRLAAELLSGSARLERYRPSDDLPGYLQEGSTVPLPQIPLTKRQAG